MSARYSRQSGYTVPQRQAARPSMRSVQRRFKVGPTAAKFIGMAVLAILLLVISSISSNSSTTAYRKTALDQQTAKVDQDIKSLTLNADRSQSIQDIQQSPVKDQMVPVGQPTPVDYVETGKVAGVSTDQNP